MVPQLYSYWYKATEEKCGRRYGALACDIRWRLNRNGLLYSSGFSVTYLYYVDVSLAVGATNV